jgi:hypothetical protein
VAGGGRNTKRPPDAESPVQGEVGKRSSVSSAARAASSRKSKGGSKKGGKETKADKKSKQTEGDGGGSARPLTPTSSEADKGWSGNAAALSEQRDQTVHTSQAKIKVVV